MSTRKTVCQTTVIMNSTAAKRWTSPRRSKPPSQPKKSRASQLSLNLSAKPETTSTMKVTIRKVCCQTSFSVMRRTWGLRIEQAPDLPEEVERPVQQHRADDDDDGDDVDPLDDIRGGGLQALTGDPVDRPVGHLLGDARVAFAAGFLQVRRVDRGGLVGAGQDAVHAVAGGAVGHVGVAGLALQAVVAVDERGQAAREPGRTSR